MSRPPADWQLPPGVSRALWDYVHASSVAEGYDRYLGESQLTQLDVEFCARFFTQPGRLLDLGCGTGRLLTALASRGWKPVGVDLSASMLDMARAKAGPNVPLLRANLVELDALADASFDHAACLFSTLGMVAGAEARQKVIQHAFRLLRPGGRLVLHVHNRWFNLRDAAGRAWLLRDTPRWLCRHSQAGDRPMPPHQGVVGLSLHHFTRREAVRLLTTAGFGICDVCPLDLQGRLCGPWWFGSWRAYGFLLAAERPRG
jgi:SAM-dependent methyltransferase